MTDSFHWGGGGAQVFITTVFSDYREEKNSGGWGGSERGWMSITKKK